MPSYEWKCHTCGLEKITVSTIAEKPAASGELECVHCGAFMTQQVSQIAVQGDEAAWLNSVVDVVDRDGGRHCQEFINTPSRSNYEKWQRGEGIRPLEPGEGLKKGPTAKEKQERRAKTVDKLAVNHQKRNAMSIRTNT